MSGLTALGSIANEDLEVGKTYSFYLKNRSKEKGKYVLPEYITPYGGTYFVCKPDGSVTVQDTSSDEGDWGHEEMGDYERARYVVEEGDYLVFISTSDGLDVLLDDKKEEDPLVIVSKVEKLEDLEVFDSMEIRIRVMEKFRANQMPFMDGLSLRIIEAISSLKR